MKLLQEILLEPLPQDDGVKLTLETTGWRMLVGCIMLNQTSRKQVDTVWPAFFERFPTAQSVVVGSFDGYHDSAYRLLSKLGFGMVRTHRIHDFSTWWLFDRPIGFDVMDGPGCGQYAWDSWQIFVLRERDIDPQDKELRRYLGLPALQTKPEEAR